MGRLFKMVGVVLFALILVACDQQGGLETEAKPRTTIAPKPSAKVVEKAVTKIDLASVKSYFLDKTWAIPYGAKFEYLHFNPDGTGKRRPSFNDTVVEFNWRLRKDGVLYVTNAGYFKQITFEGPTTAVVRIFVKGNDGKVVPESKNLVLSDFNKW